MPTYLHSLLGNSPSSHYIKMRELTKDWGYSSLFHQTSEVVQNLVTHLSFFSSSPSSLSSLVLETINFGHLVRHPPKLLLLFM